MFTISPNGAPPMEIVFAFEYLKWVHVVRTGSEGQERELTRKEQATHDIALTTIQQYLTGERIFATPEPTGGSPIDGLVSAMFGRGDDKPRAESAP